MSGKASASTSVTSQEFVVRIPKEVTKTHSILKFHHSIKTDLTKAGPLCMERENNLKDYKLSHDMDTQPKYGEGSEFGREQREEARRKKYGIYRKKYKPEDQPWLMKLGENKNVKKLKGVKEGGIADNVSYFVFTQCPDGAFEAYPVDDWYHFTPEITYKSLSAEEAEEEFQRRDKTLNFFSIMLKKRLKNDDSEDLDEVKEKPKKGKRKDFLLTDLDEWAVMSDADGDSNSDQEQTENQDKKKKKKGKQKTKKFTKTNSDDEALEESDSVDEGEEVDYITDSDSEDEDMYQEKGGEEADSKYKEQGVEDEEGLKKLVQSDEEDEEDGEGKKKKVPTATLR